MDEAVILEQARLIQRSFLAFRKHIVSRHSTTCGERDDTGYDLTIAQMNMVFLVRERGQVSVRDLSEALQVSPPSVSSMVDRLVEMGILTREQNMADRREVVIRTSPSAESGIEAIERRSLNAIVEILHKLGPAKARMWCEIQSQVISAIGEGGSFRECDAGESGEAGL